MLRCLGWHLQVVMCYEVPKVFSKAKQNGYLHEATLKMIFLQSTIFEMLIVMFKCKNGNLSLF